MKMTLSKYLINIFILFFVGCGMNINEEEKFIDDLPVLEVSSMKIDINSRFKNYGSDITAIKSQDNVLLFGYYKANTKTSDGKSRWYISQTFGSLKNFIFSLMPIENNLAGWGEVSKSAATLDIFNNKVTIGNIEDNFSFDYKDWGLREDKHNPIIQKDIEMIRNSTVDIEWWFFKASNGSWYIVNDSSIYKFASKNGLYDWQKIDLDGLEIQFFVDNGVKKMKLEQQNPLTSENTLTGVDLSDNNGDIDWVDVINSKKIQFAFIKATEGYPDDSFPESKAYDSQFENNMYYVPQSDILMGAYHFARPTFNIGVEEAKKEADYFVSKISQYYFNNKMLPPVLDIEESEGYTKQELTDWILAFMQQVELRMGVKPMLYMSEDYRNNKVNIEQLKDYKLWVAKYLYDSTDGIQIDTLEHIAEHTEGEEFRPIHDDWTFWQFSSTSFNVSGISSQYYDKNTFRGDINDLKALLVQSVHNEANPTEPNWDSGFYHHEKDGNGNYLQGYWYRGYAPKRFYDYSKGEFSELDKCSTGVEALGNCTWYAKSRARELGGTVPYETWGNAKNFDEYAINAGYIVNNNPSVGSIAQHNRDTYGHVAVVEKINQDGTITISESSYAPCSSTWNFLHRVRSVNPSEFDNYIHVEK